MTGLFSHADSSLDHLSVGAECTQGNFQCSKTGGTEADNSVEVIERETNLWQFVTLTGYITQGGGLLIFLLGDFLMLTFFTIAFGTLGGLAFYKSQID